MNGSTFMCFLTAFILTAQYSNGQECFSSVIIKLQSTRGGGYANQQVTLTNKEDGKTYSQKSNASGEAKLMVPCNSMYAISIPNYTRKREILSSESKSGGVMQTFTYEPDMVAKEKLFEMTAEEKINIDSFIGSLPDTIVMPNAVMEKPVKLEYYSKMDITIEDIENKPLAAEQLSIIGEKSNKNIKGTTDKNGRLQVYLPKGDKYFINFKHHKNFISMEVAYSKGFARAELNFSYLGTKEVEKRKKAEAERIAAEEKRLKEELLAFEKECKKSGITVEEGRRREMAKMVTGGGYGTNDTVVSVVLNRNKVWSDKLIVCDLTGSMSPYAAQLAAWYQLTCLKEKNLQFVFFNDGDRTPDEMKKIGNTGGIYYSTAKGIDSLYKSMANVASRGSGGDCPENNMEALIKGVKIAKPYKELVMIADNNAPVKDISLLKNFHAPVHIILCGVYDFILTDYLAIAWKTKGSIHTMEEDITKLASMLEGQEIKIGNSIYKIMGGEFVKINKI